MSLQFLSLASGSSGNCYYLGNEEYGILIDAGKGVRTIKKVLKEYDEIVHIPMSSGLSGSCETALMLAQDYEGKVQVVNNQRISVTQRQSVLDAMA